LKSVCFATRDRIEFASLQPPIDRQPLTRSSSIQGELHCQVQRRNFYRFRNQKISFVSDPVHDDDKTPTPLNKTISDFT
jgi:hypothetical protein